MCDDILLKAMRKNISFIGLVKSVGTVIINKQLT